jgi:Fe-S-cluster-containing hydrogenase component 2
MKAVRKIVRIDEEKCNGCGLCMPSCHEGALQIINGKARLVSEIYCDGLGACLGECPQGAITIEERASEEFNEKAVKARFEKKEEKLTIPTIASKSSALAQWPIQLHLVNPKAPYFQDADLMVVADCVPFAYSNFHQDFLKEKSIVVGCPKLDDVEFYEEKLAEIFRQSKIKSITVVNMEVPCCYGLHYIVKKAMERSGKNIPIEQMIIGIKGERKQ